MTLAIMILLAVFGHARYTDNHIRRAITENKCEVIARLEVKTVGDCHSNMFYKGMRKYELNCTVDDLTYNGVDDIFGYTYSLSWWSVAYSILSIATPYLAIDYYLSWQSGLTLFNAQDPTLQKPHFMIQKCRFLRYEYVLLNIISMLIILAITLLATMSNNVCHRTDKSFLTIVTTIYVLTVTTPNFLCSYKLWKSGDRNTMVVSIMANESIVRGIVNQNIQPSHWESLLTIATIIMVPLIHIPLLGCAWQEDVAIGDHNTENVTHDRASRNTILDRPLNVFERMTQDGRGRELL